jgi:hypothetical protein
VSTSARPSGGHLGFLGLGEAETATALDDALAMLDVDDWTATVRSAQGREIPAAEIPWVRIREVWIHAVDLGVPYPGREDDERHGISRRPGWMADRPGRRIRAARSGSGTPSVAMKADS